MIAFVDDRLPAEPAAVRLARHALAVALLPEMPDEVLDSTLLLATEAASTALTCTAQPWVMRVDVRPERVRVTVEFLADHDATSHGDHDKLQDVLFAALSDDWGFELVDGGRSTIWFEVGRAPLPV